MHVSTKTMHVDDKNNQDDVDDEDNNDDDSDSDDDGNDLQYFSIYKEVNLHPSL